MDLVDQKYKIEPQKASVIIIITSCNTCLLKDILHSVLKGHGEGLTIKHRSRAGMSLIPNSTSNAKLLQKYILFKRKKI